MDVSQPEQHRGVDIRRGVRQQVSEIRVGVDAMGAYERRSTSKQCLIGGVATDNREQRKLLQSMGKGSRGRGWLIGENPG